MQLSVIIVNWNSRNYLERCIGSILDQTREIEFEIVVIDSGSFDGCERMLRERYPQVRFLQSTQNLGFARANNAAVEHSSGECLLFLNPDTELVGPAADILYARLNSAPDAAAVGCKLLNSDLTLQSSCVQALPTLWNQILDSDVLRARWPKSRLWGMAPMHAAEDQMHHAEAISGACLMVRRDRFEEVGHFSENYFMYAEDIDLCYKLRSAGYHVYYVPEATVVHHGGTSAGQTGGPFSAVMQREAVWRFFRKTRGGAYATAYRCGMLASAASRLTMLAVARLGRGRIRPLKASYRKWLAISLWAVKRDGIVKQYYATDNTSSFERPRPRRAHV